MDNDLIFHEVQKPSKTMAVIFGAIVIISIVVLSVIYIATDMKEWIVYFFSIPSTFFIGVLLSSILSLTVSIDEYGLSYKCALFKSAYNHISFIDIDEIVIGKINVPFRYKGFKLQGGPNGKLYLFGGYDAITVNKKNGETIILGTNKKEELIKAVSKIENVNISIV